MLTRWICVGAFFIVALFASIDWGPIGNSVLPPLSVLVLFIASLLHSYARYGVKSTVVFFLITWVVSHFFEALSIRVGFPFGHYYYDQLIGPRLFDVPLIIMPAYFSMGYLSWTLSQVLLGRFHTFLTPFVGTFIMVMWDLCMDPSSSTLGSLWVWTEGGSYFGVPLQNFFGWFFVVYIVLQLFAFYIRKEVEKPLPKMFWMEAVLLYGIQALFLVTPGFFMQEHREIYGPLALITIFTMIFVTLLSFIKVTLKGKNFYSASP